MIQKSAKVLGERYKRGVAKLAGLRQGNPAFALRVIVVSGAAGKTTTASLIAGLLREAGHTVDLLVNREVTFTSGVQAPTEFQKPNQLQKQLRQSRKNGVEFVVLEVSDTLLNSEILSAIPLDTVVVTTVNDAYETCIEKLLGYGANYAVLPHSTKAQRANHMAIADHQIITFGNDHDADAMIGPARLYRKGTEVHVTIDHQTNFTLASYLIGSLNARNVTAAIATAYVLGADTKTFEEGVAGVEQVEGNYQYVDEDEIYTVVIDGATQPSSLQEVVKSARALTKRRLTVVVDGIEIDDELLESLKNQSDRLIITAVDTTVRIGVEIANDAKHAIEIARRGARKDDTVLLVGPAFAVHEANGRLYGEELIEPHE